VSATPQRHRVVVLDHAIDRHRFPARGAERRAIDACGERLAVGVHRDDLRAGQRLQRRVPADVIEVRVAGEDQPHVGQMKPQTFDVRTDEGHRRGFAAVDDDAAVGCHDQERRQSLRADVVDVADDFDCVERFSPVVLRADGGRRRREDDETGRKHAHVPDYKRPPRSSGFGIWIWILVIRRRDPA